MRRLLVVTYYAPPLGLSGVMRVTKLCKFLPEFGWKPLVLTVKATAYYHYDQRLATDLVGAKVFRTESLDPARVLNRLRPGSARLRPLLTRGLGRLPRLLNHVLFPDSKLGWFPFASVAGRHIIDQQRPTAILATSPPFTALLVGVRLKAHAHLPLVSDFRDAWPTGFALPPLHQRAALRALRSYVVRHSDLVLAVNRGTAEAVGPRASVLPNGFDPTDFEAEAERLHGFSIVHVGNLWENEPEMRMVVAAINGIADARLYLAGRVGEKARRWLGANPRVSILGVLPHRESCRLMKSADLLLYLGKPSQPVGLKLYEYLGARRPVVVFGRDTGEAAEIVHRCHAGVVCEEPASLRGCVEQLRAKSEQSSGSMADRRQFDRREQARWLAQELERMLD